MAIEVVTEDELAEIIFEQIETDTIDPDIDHQALYEYLHNDTGSLLNICKKLNIRKYFPNRIFMEEGSQPPSAEFEKMNIDKNEKNKR